MGYHTSQRPAAAAASGMQPGPPPGSRGLLAAAGWAAEASRWASELVHLGGHHLLVGLGQVGLQQIWWEEAVRAAEW